jgi:hypothetical protein
MANLSIAIVGTDCAGTWSRGDQGPLLACITQKSDRAY